MINGLIMRFCVSFTCLPKFSFEKCLTKRVSTDILYTTKGGTQETQAPQVLTNVYMRKGRFTMKKFEILRMLQTKIIDNVNSYDEYLDATENHGSFTVEAPNLFRAIIIARKRETKAYDDAIEFGDNYYCYPDWLEVWEVGDDGMYTGVRRYVFPM